MAEEVNVVIIPNLDKAIHRMPEVGGVTQELANAIAMEARADAPVETGSYRDKIQVQKSNRSNSGIWRVYAGSKKSAWIEFGIPNQGRPGLFVLRNAAARVGATFIKSRKR